MAKAYLRVWVYAGKESPVFKAVQKVKGVKAAHLTAGDQDLMVLLEGKDFDDILRNVIRNVRVIDGVRGTATNLVLD